QDHAGPQFDRADGEAPRHASCTRPRPDRPHRRAVGEPAARRYAAKGSPPRSGRGVFLVPDRLNLSNLKPAQNRVNRKRIGRGLGSGKGRYAGRGLNGQKSRAGSHKMRPGFEGGQMPIYMRLGKQRGQYSKDAMPVGPHRTLTQSVNVRDLERVFAAGAEITPELLKEKRLIRTTRIDVKVLGEGELTKKLTVHAHGFSKTAREK